MFKSVEELIHICETENKSIADVMIAQEMAVSKLDYETVMSNMERNLIVMEQAVARGLDGVTSPTGLTGMDAVKLRNYIAKGNTLSGATLLDAVSKAVATNEVNAAMGLICATPTAGSAGVVPGTLFAMKARLNPSREQMIKFLFTTGAFGFVVANNASISGAAGGVRQK